MKHTLLLLVSAFLAQSVMAQHFFKRRPCGTTMLMEREEAQAKGNKARALSTTQNYVPHTGTITIPVVLVEFSDVKFSVNNPKEAFEQMFNNDEQKDLGNGNNYNNSSVGKYFRDMSNGNFSPEFKVYGPVTLDKPETYYGGKKEDDNSDENPRQLVKDVLKLVESYVTQSDLESFSCSDGNTLDCVYVVYAGLGQNDGGAGSAIWANTWTTDGATLCGKNVRWYTMSGELCPLKLNETGSKPAITGIGVPCHEFSHSLGLPDIYPTAAAAKIDNQNMEYWDIMDGGEYTYNGFRPTAYTAFEKEQMEWPVDIKALDSDASISMTTSTEQHGTAYKIVNPDNRLEYFMLECIQRKGWNKYIFGNGLLVYHVNMPNNTLMINTKLNNVAGYPGMAVVPADGACLSSYIEANSPQYFNSQCGDLFPGTGNVANLNVTELSDSKTLPNFCWYNTDKTERLKTNKALRNIKYENGALTFDYVNDVASSILPIIGGTQATYGKVYSINGTFLGYDFSTLPHGIYIKDGQKIVK